MMTTIICNNNENNTQSNIYDAVIITIVMRAYLDHKNVKTAPSSGPPSHQATRLGLNLAICSVQTVTVTSLDIDNDCNN